MTAELRILSLPPIRRGTTPPRQARRLGVAIAASCVPTLIPLTDRDTLGGGPLLHVASVLGMLGLTLLWWQMILGISQLTRILRLDRDAAIAAHTMLGVSGFLVIALHPILWRLADDQPWAFLWKLEFGFVEARWVSLGRAALVLLLIVWLSSTVARYALRYRGWRLVHYLTYPTTVLAFLHSFGATGLTDNYLALQMYWWALAVGLTVALLAAAASNLATAPSRLLARRVDGDLAVLEVGGAAQRLPTGPGQFVTLRTRRLATAHPFTVVGRGPDGTLRLAVARRGPHTQRLASMPLGEPLWISGPYGSLLADVDTRHPRVFLAGGIGITPFVAYLNSGVDLTDTHVFHLIRDPAPPQLLSPPSKAQLGGRFQTINTSARPRLTVDDIDPQLRDEATFWICGSPGFVDSWDRQLRRAGIAGRRIRAERYE